MHKLSHLVDSEWLEHSFPPVFAEPNATSETKCLVVGLPGGDSSVFERLALLAEPPFLLLYARKDYRQLIRQARQFRSKLEANRVRARLVVADDSDHVSIVFNAVLPQAEHGREVLRFVREG